MSCLLDTSILARLANASDAQNTVAVHAVEQLHREGEALSISPQNIVEFWNVASRPVSVNGLGLSPDEVARLVALFESRFVIVPETPAIYVGLKNILAGAQVIAKQVHDARLVAICHANNIARILTFNVRHFDRFTTTPPGVDVIHPPLGAAVECAVIRRWPSMAGTLIATTLCVFLTLAAAAPIATAAENDEITPASETALERGLAWLAKNQGVEGSWGSNDLGLVSMGALAFMSAGHAPGRGKYGRELDKALEFIISRSRPSGLLNISDAQRDMYNHGLATFVLGQAYGMTTSKDRKLSRVLDGALKLIATTQCEDGGWDYRAQRQAYGHDLSLAVMQAKALRSAVDNGLEIPPEVIDLAIRSVRDHYSTRGGRGLPESEQQKLPGQFTYSKGGGGGTIAMAAAGVVCLQEFGQYDDWRIGKNMEVIQAAILETPRSRTRDGSMPFDAYTLYYVGQALYQVGGEHWKSNYPRLRDYLIESQVTDASNPASHGAWRDHGSRGGGRVGGKDGELYATSVACFILAIPNRYLPILQEGKIEGFKAKAGTK